MSKIKVIEIVEVFFFLIIKTSNAEAGSQLLCIVNMTNRSQELFIMSRNPGGGGRLRLYKGLMGTCGQPGYVFRDFCLNQGIDFINFFLKLDCLQSAFSLKIRPDETKKESLCTHVPPPSEKKSVSYFFFSGLRPRFSRQAASPLACSNFARKNKGLLAV